MLISMRYLNSLNNFIFKSNGMAFDKRISRWYTDALVSIVMVKLNIGHCLF